jgi:hypothetical protein
MFKAERIVLSVLLFVLHLLLVVCVAVWWQWALAVLVTIVVFGGGALLWHWRELRRLNWWIEDKCEGCGYDLRGLGRAGRCPECGKSFKGLGVDARGVPV